MSDDDAALARPLSRRAFLRTAAIGAAVLAGAGLESLPALADEEQGGTLTLSAFPITYVPAPLSLQGMVSLTVTSQRTDTLMLSSQVDETVSLSFDQTVSGTGFSVMTGQTIKQTVSSAVTNAVTLRTTSSQGWGSQALPAEGGYASVDDTTFACVFNPSVGFSGNLNRGFKFKFLNASSILVCNAANLTPADTQGFYAALGAPTAAAIRSIYPLQAGMLSGRQLGLAKPRFKFKKLIVAGPSSSPYSYSNTVDSSTTVNVTTSAKLNVEIKQTVGFTSTDPTSGVKLEQMFGQGRTLEVTVSGVQERTQQTIYTTAGTLTNDRQALVHFRYVDRLWKTDLITLEGPLSSFPAAVRASVVNPDGSPMAGAIVALVNGNESYEAVTDAGGSCTIASPQALPSGTYPVLCGNLSSSVPLGGGTVGFASFEPDPGLARIPPGGHEIL
jgi:hypothetical protein